MKIGIDIDDVILASMEGYLKKLKDLEGIEIFQENISSYNFWREHGISDEKMIKFFDEFFEKHAAELEFLEGAKETIEEISKKHELFFVTARPQRFNKKTDGFFKTHFPSNNFKIFHTDVNAFDKEGKCKADICKENEIELMIDDNLSELFTCSENDIRCLLFEKPWTKNTKINDKIIRVKSWNEILEKLK